MKLRFEPSLKEFLIQSIARSPILRSLPVKEAFGNGAAKKAEEVVNQDGVESQSARQDGSDTSPDRIACVCLRASFGKP